MPRQKIATKKTRRVERSNSFSLPEVNKMRMASSLVLKKREARSL
jgi:hypothetical protein